MGRRIRFGLKNRFENGSRQSVGDYYVDKACAEIDQACAKEAAMFVASFTVHQVVPMLFRDEVVTKLKAVHGCLALEDTSHHYDLKPWANGTVYISTKDLMPTPNEAARHWYAERAQPLLQAIQGLNELHIKWGAVKHLLRWFNRNATPGAVRANWPSVLQLCPDAPALKELQHAPVRYTNPQELSALLPLIRATATTVASMAMIPGDAEVRLKGTVWIALPARVVEYEGTAINLNQQIFHL